MHGDEDADVVRSFKGVEPGPVVRQRVADEQAGRDGGTARAPLQDREAEISPPTRLPQHAGHDAVLPGAGQIGHDVVVYLSRREGAVDGEAVPRPEAFVDVSLEGVVGVLPEHPPSGVGRQEGFGQFEVPGGSDHAPKVSPEPPFRQQGAILNIFMLFLFSGPVRPGAVLAASLLWVGCANVVNLSDPRGPRFEGSYAPVVREAGARAPVELQVATFNVKLARHVDRALAVIQESPGLRDADVLAMQELDERATDSLARALKLNYVYFPGAIHPADDRYFGPAILSRWPIDSAWKLVLPHEGDVRQQRRTATAALVRVRGRPVRVYAVHLEVQTRVSRAEREDQVAAVLSDAAGAREPVVIAGDFNSWSIGHYLTDRGFAWPTRDLGPTVLLFNWDHIFARGLVEASGDSAGVVKDVRGASDHRPVWATLAMAPVPAAAAVTAP